MDNKEPQTPQSSRDEKQLTLNTLRYSLIQLSLQASLFKSAIPDPKGHALLPFLDKLGSRYDFKYHESEFVFLNFSRIENTPRGQYYIGRLAKKTKKPIGEISTNNDVRQRHVDSWVAIWIMFEVDHQYIFTENNHEFGDINHVSNVLKLVLSEFSQQTYDHTVIIEPVLVENSFWELVASAEKIYRIRLAFVSPNIFGAEAKSKEWLDSVKRLFNQEKAVITIENSRGELVADREHLKGPMKYIENGEGAWEVRARGPNQRKAVTHKSENHIEKVTMKIPQSAAPTEQPAAPADTSPPSEPQNKDHVHALVYSHVAQLIAKRHGY